jgi:hypothetical protein
MPQKFISLISFQRSDPSKQSETISYHSRAVIPASFPNPSTLVLPSDPSTPERVISPLASAFTQAPTASSHMSTVVTSRESSVTPSDFGLASANIFAVPSSLAATKAPKKIAKKKYKPVALKVRPILGELPDKFRIIRDIVGDPLMSLLLANQCSAQHQNKTIRSAKEEVRN